MKLKYDAIRIVLVAVIGLCDSIKEGVVTIDEAQHMLFSPHTMKLLSFDNELKEIIHMATELEDIQSLLPDSLNQEIEAVKKAAFKKLKKLNKYDYDNDHWLDELF